jgi:hypothetical protein
MGTNAGDTIIAPGAFPDVFTSACSTNVDLANNVEVDITAATVTFTTTKANAKFIAFGSFYFSCIGGASSGIALGKLNVDGTNAAGFANFTGLFSTPERHNLAQVWTGTLAAAGVHTLKLRGVGPGTTASAAVAAHRINATSTTITVLVL